MTASPLRPSRRRSETGYACGDDTRRRIIAAALRLFGERGFEAASTREIAAAAGVNAPALQYYFENKQGVYQACAQQIADSSVQHFSPVLSRAQQALIGTSARSEDTFEALGLLLDAVADYHLLPDDEAHQQRRLFLAHEQVGQGPGALFDLLERQLRPSIAEVGLQLIARYCGVPASHPELRLRVMMLFGQVLVFSLGRRSLLSNLGWEGYGPTEVDSIKRAAREHSRWLMDGWRQAWTAR